MTTYAPRYATITMTEINYLMERNAPKNALPILLVLNSYSQDGFSCFPSIRTIAKQLNNLVSIRTVQKVIKWLVDNLVIERNSCRSKKRFVNLLRKMVYGTSKSEQSGRKKANDLDTIKNQPNKNHITSVVSLKGDKQKQKKKRTIIQKLQSAQKRVNRYTNLLNNREQPPTEQSKQTEEIKSLLSYWMATTKLGKPNLTATEDELRQLRELYENDEETREMLEFYDEIKSYILSLPFYLQY